jgi:FMN-dependent NADH-azoreductase
MPTLLSVVASPRGDYSVSRALTAKFVDAWKANHPDGNVVTRDLMTTELPFIDLPWIMGAYTPAETHSPEMKKALTVSQTLIPELEAADHIVIGTPMYNFSTPAVLKAWIDHIVLVNRTFTPSYEGLLKGKKVTVIIAAAGVYSPGSHMESWDRETSYLKQILGFIGLTDVTFIAAYGTSDIDTGKATREQVMVKFTPEVEAAAA